MEFENLTPKRDPCAESKRRGGIYNIRARFLWLKRMLSKLAQFLLNKLHSKSILLKYAILILFGRAAAFMYILLQA